MSRFEKEKRPRASPQIIVSYPQGACYRDLCCACINCTNQCPANEEQTFCSRSMAESVKHEHSTVIDPSIKMYSHTHTRARSLFEPGLLLIIVTRTQTVRHVNTNVNINSVSLWSPEKRMLLYYTTNTTCLYNRMCNTIITVVLLWTISPFELKSYQPVQYGTSCVPYSLVAVAI